MKKSGKSGERSKKMIKTDKAVYRVRTQEEFFWIIDRLDEAGCKWIDGRFPGDYDEEWVSPKWVSHIWVRNEKISCSDTESFYDYYKDRQDYKFIEVSDLMENEKKTEILEKLETLNEHLEDELKKIEKGDDEQQKIKKIVYTTEVYFE